MKLNVLFSVICIIIFITASCSKEEGVGGNATIRGKVVIHDYNDDFSILLSQRDGAEEDVYIIYGDEKTFGDEIETNYDGVFEFKYLLPGNYNVFIYSEDSSNIMYDKVVAKDAKISKKDDLVDIGTFVKINTLDYDDGNSSITGRIYEVNYNPNTICTSFPQADTALAQEEDVYIVYGNHGYFDERIRTHYDGTFTFINLIKGIYEIFVYSEDLSGATEKIPIKQQVEISEENQHIVLPDIYINNL